MLIYLSVSPADILQELNLKYLLLQKKMIQCLFNFIPLKKNPVTRVYRSVLYENAFFSPTALQT